MVGISTIGPILLFLGLSQNSVDNSDRVSCMCNSTLEHDGINIKGLPSYCRKKMNMSVLDDCILDIYKMTKNGSIPHDKKLDELLGEYSRDRCQGINKVSNCLLTDATSLGKGEMDVKVKSDIPVRLKGRGKDLYCYPKRGIFMFLSSASNHPYSFRFDVLYPKYVYHVPSLENCTRIKWELTDFFSVLSYKCKGVSKITLGDFEYIPGDEVINKNCKNSDSYTTVKLLSEGNYKEQGNYDDSYLVCKNGTIKRMNQNLYYMKDCGSVHVFQQLKRCVAVKENDYCSITDKIENGVLWVKVKTEKPGTILINKDGTTTRTECDYQCEIEIGQHKTASVTCPNGLSRTYEDHVIENDCPFIAYWSTGVLAGYVCKATRKPTLFWVLISFIVVGKYAFGVLYLILDYMLYLVVKIYQKAKKRMKPVTTICKCCEEEICFKELEVRHKTCCNNVCPYCRRFVEGLIEHSNLCPDKIVIISELEKKAQIKGRFHRFTSRVFKRSHIGSGVGSLLNILFCVVILLIIVSPIEAYTNQWDRDKEALDLCYSSCFHTEDSCLCVQNDAYDTEVAAEKKYGSPDSLPKGFIGIGGNLKPGFSNRNIDLTFTTAYEDENKVHIKGNSILNMQLETYSGAFWNIHNPHSDQKGVYSVAIIDFRQIYKTKFAFWTMDRHVKSGSNNVCTGSCPNNCKCTSSTCKVLRQENIRSWTCNPSWCWNIGGGCSCCFIKAEPKDINYIIGAFDMEYVDTEIYFCLKHELKEYECKILKQNDVIESGEVSVKVTKTFGIDTKLPTRGYVLFKKFEDKFDFTHIDDILFTSEICSESSCSHGEVGDYKFYSLQNLEEEMQVEMSWTDVTQNLECESFHWPNCRVENVVVKNTDKFENVIKRASKIGEKFSHREGFIGNALSADPALELNVRPKKGGGSIEVFLQINDLVLKKKEVKIEVGKFEVKACSGCYSCQEGISCYVKLLLNSNEECNLHFYSTTDHVLVEGDTTRVEKGKKAFNITLYSPTQQENIEICIEETKQCTKAESLNIIEPEHRLTSKHKVIDTSERDEGKFTLGGIWNGISNFFSNIWYGFKSIFSLKFIGIVLLVVLLSSVIYIVVVILFRKKVKKDYSKLV